jgi:hypothetical protein
MFYSTGPCQGNRTAIEYKTTDPEIKGSNPITAQVRRRLVLGSGLPRKYQTKIKVLTG